MGLFLVLIALVDAGIARRNPDAAGTTVPVSLGVGGKLLGWPTLVFAVTLIVMLVLFVRRIQGAILIGIGVGAVLAIIVESIANAGSVVDKPTGWSLNVPALPDKVVDSPDLGLLGKFNLFHSWQTAGILLGAMFVFTLLLSDFFKTIRVAV